MEPTATGEIFIARILTLEDDPRTRQFLRDAIGGFLKHDVRAASGLQEALALARSVPFDLMLLDQRLRDGTALDFCRALPTSCLPVPKWILTGEKPLSWDSRLWDLLGVRGYLLKPVSLDLLMETIGSCLESRKP